MTGAGDGPAQGGRGLFASEWVLIAFLRVAYVPHHADRQVVCTLFPALHREFGFSNTGLGLNGALFLLVYGACSPFAGIVGDRWSRHAGGEQSGIVKRDHRPIGLRCQRHDTALSRGNGAGYDRRRTTDGLYKSDLSGHGRTGVLRHPPALLPGSPDRA